VWSNHLTAQSSVSLLRIALTRRKKFARQPGGLARALAILSFCPDKDPDTRTYLRVCPCLSGLEPHRTSPLCPGMSGLSGEPYVIAPNANDAKSLKLV
jgi:hypothetical protein